MLANALDKAATAAQRSEVGVGLCERLSGATEPTRRSRNFKQSFNTYRHDSEKETCRKLLKMYAYTRDLNYE
jgi:hypothetical protein